MARIYTSDQDERIIKSIIEKGLAVKTHKWVILRLALANSLKNPEEPEEEFDQIKDKVNGGEYGFTQVTGFGQEKDYTDVYKAMLSVYHQIDLFSNEDTFRKLLRRHIRRGLKEFRTNWTETHDFHEYLYQEFLSDYDDETEKEAHGDSQKLEKALLEIGVSGTVKKVLNGPRITRYQVLLNYANDLDKPHQS